MRLFFAVEIPQELKKKISLWVEEIQQGCPQANLSWVAPQNYHLTLAFLGESPQSQLETLQGASQAAAGIAAIDASLEGLGIFPALLRPRVLWIGLPQGAGDIRTISANLALFLKNTGVSFDKKPFSPHLTVGRFRGHPNPKTISLLRGYLERPDPVLGHWAIESFSLMESRLRGGAPPVYNTLARFPLGS
ncbi:MAG: RNA 2',3'-cyclic phosphodiesterase [Elusimicrobia bacterium]|nr:RNA 2',3'-cyclic phosphodiesterase [Elusimicrobiota bacterium]